MFVKGDGSVLFDEKGNKYVDLCSGGNYRSILGHGIDIAKNLLANVNTVTTFMSEGHKRLEDIMTQFCPEYNWVFMTSEYEAVEQAIKVVYDIKTKDVRSNRILVLDWHTQPPRTFALEAINYPVPRRSCFEFLHVPLGVFRQDDIPTDYLEPIDACLINPITRSGAQLTLKEYERIGQLTASNEGILIVDERLSCLGRCGVPTFLSHKSQWQDIVILGSSLAQGFPFAAVGVKKEFRLRDLSLMEHTAPSVTCGIAANVVDVVMKQNLTQASVTNGYWWQGYYNQYQDHFIKAGVKSLTVCGSLVNLKFGTSLIAADCCSHLRNQHNILCGSWEDTLVIAPDYLIQQDIHSQAMQTVLQALMGYNG